MDQDVNLPPEEGQAVHVRFLKEAERFAESEEAKLRTIVFFFSMAIIVFLALTIVGIPLAIYSARQYIKNSKAHKKNKAAYAAAVEFAKGSQFVFAYPLMINATFFKPGNAPACGLVLICFHPLMTNDEMIRLVVGIVSPPSDWSREDIALAEKLMGDEKFQRHRRRLLPESMTGGKRVYACDMVLWREFIPGGKWSSECPYVPCMAESGREGRIMHLPWWIYTGETAPSEHELAASMYWFKTFNTFQPHTVENATEI